MAPRIIATPPPPGSGSRPVARGGGPGGVAHRMASPFFNPSTPRKEVVVLSTPGGTHYRARKPEVEEHKSTVLGCSANLINAIVGAGIVGIPFAMDLAGLIAGVLLVVLCAVLTLKSLRLLVGTAQEIHAPSYETLAEAAFGSPGFHFISANMFVMAYGAMVSYLMIVKDTVPVVFGVDPDNLPLKRSILFVLSLLTIVPLSAQRDMADLAKTSRVSVVFDILMVLLVAATSPIAETIQQQEQQLHSSEGEAGEGGIGAEVGAGAGGLVSIIEHSTIRMETIFAGLGVLSFAFVCQHSAFIVAGSLERPTKARWGCVTLISLTACGVLATVCGVTGYLGFLDQTKGNILNNFHPDSPPANVARGLLAATMLFVYPMESFVARHVLVVTLFSGRRAHEGEDSSVLNRRDRRLILTLGLYTLALIPALCFENLGSVLSVTGAIGGSCLSYIGPGVCYLGVYGHDFIRLSHPWYRNVIGGTGHAEGGDGRETDEETAAGKKTTTTRQERKPLTAIHSLQTTGAEVDVDQRRYADTRTSLASVTTTTAGPTSSCSSCLLAISFTASWYLCAMPLWTWIASVGRQGLQRHQQDLALKSPHLSRIAAPHSAGRWGDRRTVRAPLSWPPASASQGGGASTAAADAAAQCDHLDEEGRRRVSANSAMLTPTLSGVRLSSLALTAKPPTTTMTTPSYQKSIPPREPSQGGGPTITMLSPTPPQRGQQKRAREENAEELHRPRPVDFVIAIFYTVFGAVAMSAGLVSIFSVDAVNR